MSARIVINEGCAVAIDPVRATEHTTKGVLITLEGRTPGDCLNCALVPMHKMGDLIASLQMVYDEARKA